MNISKMLKLARLIAQFADVETDKGTLTATEEIVEGVEVYIKDENEEFIPATDGEYVTETQIIVVKDGKVEEIRDKETDPQPDEPANEEFSKENEICRGVIQ